MAKLPQYDAASLLALEALVDRFSLASTLHALAHIAQEKSAHVTETWQDSRLSADWDKAAAITGKAANATERNTRR